ncbi:hypothetical protein Ddye_024582 [Dipteronia dyeriana]|uniref:Reverse transcriptase domain-containing protein n=1 Tax=Dipteronia dyeriana TaxID=168575 RepID=A0AAD9TV51_9ROSI|nr:hypothetical protein Ddye_024582 [Dipteronia dyeriana]
MVVEVLSRMLNKARVRGLIKGIGFRNDVVHITHLQFADDTMLFIEPRMEYLSNAKRILCCFELVSGLKINFHKSCLVKIGKKFLGNDKWARVFRCTSADLPITYLGLLLGGNQSREALWNPIIKKVKDRLAIWKRSFTSKSGRLVLIKDVLSSLPTYFVSVFGLSLGVAKKIKKIQRNFFWNDGNVKRKVHVADWDTICKSQKLGGLGIGRMKDKGLNLLVK